MKKSKLFILAAIAGFAASAQAQIVIKDKAAIQPYVVSGDWAVEKDGLGNCVRTSNYSTALISSVMTTKNTPVGVECGEIKAAAPVAAPAVAPAAKPAAKAAPVAAPAPAANKVSLPADAVFAYDKADLTEQGKSGLSKFAADAKALKQLEVVIAVGHADRIGSPAYNQKLSEKRAATVKDFLVAQGIAANKVYTEGKGETQPVSGASCAKMGAETGKNKKLVDCLAADRRVELEAVGTK